MPPPADAAVPAAAAPPPLLHAERLTRRFGGLAAVDAVSLDLRLGEIHAVIGTNGAGKSTLVNLLSGELPLSAGSIRFAGHDITGWPQPKRARAGIGRSYQRTTIFAEFSVFENCRLAAQAATPRPWAIWQAAVRCDASVAAAEVALAAAGLAALAGRPARSLSHGGQRQLEIAMCLATRPQVLLLDEPLAGMGAEETERMLALLLSLKASHAVLLIEHDMDAVFRVADRITVMVNGQVIASDRPARIRSDPQVQMAYLGEEVVGEDVVAGVLVDQAVPGEAVFGEQAVGEPVAVDAGRVQPAAGEPVAGVAATDGTHGRPGG